MDKIKVSSRQGRGKLGEAGVVPVSISPGSDNPSLGLSVFVKTFQK
jgi:hypothetical protein